MLKIKEIPEQSIFTVCVCIGQGGALPIILKPSCTTKAELNKQTVVSKSI